MAASGEENVSSEESDDNIQEKACMMCVNPPGNPKIVPFSARTWNTFLKYVPKWKSLDGDQAEVANKFIDKHAEFNIDNVVDANAIIPIPLHGGYHQMCYTRFTDSQRVIKSMQKLATKGRFIKVMSTIRHGNDIGLMQYSETFYEFYLICD